MPAGCSRPSSRVSSITRSARSPKRKLRWIGATADAASRTGIHSRQACIAAARRSRPGPFARRVVVAGAVAPGIVGALVVVPYRDERMLAVAGLQRGIAPIEGVATTVIGERQDFVRRIEWQASRRSGRRTRRCSHRGAGRRRATRARRCARTRRSFPAGSSRRRRPRSAGSRPPCRAACACVPPPSARRGCETRRSTWCRAPARPHRSCSRNHRWDPPRRARAARHDASPARGRPATRAPRPPWRRRDASRSRRDPAPDRRWPRRARSAARRDRPSSRRSH